MKKMRENQGKENGGGCEIIVFPEIERLHEEIEHLRNEVSALLMERDELKYVICKNIETEYMLELGDLEYKVYEAMCKALRMKRKLELIQAAKNRQEKVILFEIELILDEEFAQYQETLNLQIEKMKEALERDQAETLSQEEVRRLKKMYRTIVKAIHPDIHPDVTKEQRELFYQAVDAYKRGDLKTLEIIAVMAGDGMLPSRQEDRVRQLMEEKERLQEAVCKIQEEIRQIKSKYPYNLKEIIENPDKVEARRRQLKELLEDYQKTADIYEKRIDKMLR